MQGFCGVESPGYWPLLARTGLFYIQAILPVLCDWGGRTLLLPLPLSFWWIELAVGSLGCGFCWLWRILVQLVSCQCSCLLECAGISDQGLD